MKKSSLSVAPYLHYIARLLDVQGVSGSSPLAPTKTSETSVSEVFLFTQMTIFERSLPHRAEIQIVKAIYASAFMSMASPFYAV